MGPNGYFTKSTEKYHDPARNFCDNGGGGNIIFIAHGFAKAVSREKSWSAEASGKFNNVNGMCRG